MNTAIQTVETMQKRERALTVQPDPNMNPMQMLSLAVQRGVDTVQLEKLMDLKERWEAGEAKRAFTEAMAAFKAEPTKIVKTKDVNIPGGAKFKHATLADVVDGVVANLSKHGLSHRWVTEQQDRNAVTVRCILTHVAGHSEECVLQAPPDDSGKKNSIQQVASTVTYLQRYTLMAICGLAAKDMDTDGNAPPQKPTDPPGYEQWMLDMEAKAEEGQSALKAAWQASSQEFRNFTTKHEGDWWARMKNKAAKAGA